MHWLLILHFALDGQTTSKPVALLIDRRTCIIAGAGMAAILERANPGLTVTIRCENGSSA